MSRYLPIVVGVLLIVGLTIVQVRMTDRFSDTNITAKQQAELLKNVPMEVGDWRGTDMDVAENIKQTAGAVGVVSRRYRNTRTNEEVDLWLIVGHGRSVSAHTPDICYPSSGFSARATENSVHNMVMNDESTVPFLTNTFYREDHITGRQLYRVFWNWFNTEDEKHEGNVVWEAPTNARWHFGNTRALYKMYFTSVMRDHMETAEQSPAANFAKEFIPVVNQALSQVHMDEPTNSASTDAAAELTTAEATEEPSEPVEPATESAAPAADAIPADSN